MSELEDAANNKTELNEHFQVRDNQLCSCQDSTFEKSDISHAMGVGSNDSLPGTSCGIGEKKLANGDIFFGSWRGNLPNNSGKYTSADGCIYEGDWDKGKMSGRGKISWPSGATYEGEFSGGYMQGLGTFTGVGNTSYRGSWVMNAEHGLGRKCYSNMDVYEGFWKQGMMDGPGRYIWRNGNVYFGDWRRGAICGQGSLIWVNGDSYHGQWQNGLAHGQGIYTWSDGRYYNGTWSRGLKDGKGTFYSVGRQPSGDTWLDSPFGIRQDDMIANYESLFHQEVHFLSSLKHTQTSLCKKNAKRSLKKSESLPSRHLSMERQWSLEGSLDGVPNFNSGKESELTIGKASIKCTEGQIRENALIFEREYAQGVLISEHAEDNLQFSSRKSSLDQQWHQEKEVKRPGETIIKGHRSYYLMLNLQLGIRYSVGICTHESRIDIGTSDFSCTGRTQINFPSKGSQLTPAHQSVDFKWKDYCPMVFRSLREIFNIDSAGYCMSICGVDALRELSSPGKSGSYFYLSHDDRFMIKTLRKSELKVFLKMLPSYYNHLSKHDKTLITKCFGLHQVTLASGPKIQFVVMGNVFCTELRIHRKFDLKGSWQGRSTDKVKIDETTTLKDLDLDFVFHLESSWQQSLLEQIREDCGFLESQQIMDYSLLLGLHYRAPQYQKDLTAQSFQNYFSSRDDGILPAMQSIQGNLTCPTGLVLVAHDPKETFLSPHVRGSPLRAATVGHDKADLLLPETNTRLPIQLGVNMPARAYRRPLNQNASQQAEDFFEVHDVMLYLGIIDVFQTYNIVKRVEHVYKSLKFSSGSISAVNPQFYARRFQEFICKIFPSSV